ncbi:MAG: transporter substrate-binding domain-containing protein, partial [Pseudomonadota bacterium]
MRVLIALLLVVSATAQADNHEGTLDRIAKTGEFRIGFVPTAPPLSFQDRNGNAVGYSIDLCRHIATTIKEELELESINVTYTPLMTIEDRISAVENGDVDIECGATTVTLGRRQRVDFTLMTFITGSAVLSRKANPINTVDDINGASVAVLEGTTTEQVMRRVIDVNNFD